jgi:hypothetical protein
MKLNYQVSLYQVSLYQISFYLVNREFVITQHKRDYELLELIKNYFKEGYLIKDILYW